LAYKHFLDKYPNSHQAEDAKEIYELLLYETHTRDRNIASYENFISKFPHSPYLKEALAQLFGIYTLDHQEASFYKFIEKYPESKKADEARLWLRHLQMNYDSIGPFFFLPLKESTDLQLHNGRQMTNLIVDSIKSHLPCMPYYNPFIIYRSKGKWGLADSKGQGIIPAIFHNVEQIHDELYACKTESRYGLIHASGFMISDPLYDSLWILNDTFIVACTDTGQHLLAYNGAKLTEKAYELIELLGKDVLAIKNNRKWALAKSERFLKWPPSVDLKWRYDSVSELGKEMLAGYAGDSIFILNPALKADYAYAYDSIWRCPLGIQILKNDSFSLIGHNGELKCVSAHSIQSFNVGYVEKMDSTYRCFLYGDTISAVDSFEFFRPFYFKLYKDSSTLFLTESGKFDASNFERVSLAFYKLQASDTFSFIIAAGGKQGLISAKGDTIIPPQFEEVRVFDSLNIRVKKKGKYGLLNFKGETILRTEFDAISNFDNGGFALFHNRKFGFIHEARGIYIKAYQNNPLKLLPMRKTLFSRQTDEGIELLGPEAKKRLGIAKDYDVINDSLIFVNQDFQWHLKKLNPEGKFEDLGVACTGYEVWFDAENVPHIIFYKATGEGFYDTERESKIYPEYYSVRPKMGKNGKLKYFIAFKYYEEINLYLLKLMSRDEEELHKVLITEAALEKMGCSIE
jgi:hypothetical protein